MNPTIRDSIRLGAQNDLRFDSNFQNLGEDHPACIFWDSNINIDNNNNRIALDCVIDDFLIFCWYQPGGKNTTLFKNIM